METSKGLFTSNNYTNDNLAMSMSQASVSGGDSSRLHSIIAIGNQPIDLNQKF
jgi:hypothetical protein